MQRIPALCLLALLCSGCSQKLLTREDYFNSQQAFTGGDVRGAQAEFPRGNERGGFITTMENGYLSLLQGEPKIEGLAQQADAIETRVRYHVSREARTFFYVQTPDDYYASEHEVVWLHMLLSWGYSLQGKYEDGCVEARQASSLLTLPWSPNGHFDDPAMRLFLATLWTMCGEWHEAQVDFRAAYDMDNRLAWANALAQRAAPPAQLFVALGGPGPEPEWNPDRESVSLRKARRVRFELRGMKSALAISDRQSRAIEAHLSPDARNWYARLLERESELHELIADSAYGGKGTANGVWAGTKIAATTGAGVLIGVGGTALGVALCVGGTQAGANPADACKIGASIALISIAYGTKVAKEGYADSKYEFKLAMDPSRTYRFVRYLPEYLWMGWSDGSVAYPVKLSTPTDHVAVNGPGIGKDGIVHIAYVPDTGDSPEADNTQSEANLKSTGFGPPTAAAGSDGAAAGSESVAAGNDSTADSGDSTASTSENIAAHKTPPALPAVHPAPCRKTVGDTGLTINVPRDAAGGCPDAPNW